MAIARDVPETPRPPHRIREHAPLPQGPPLPDIFKGDEDEESDASETAQAEPEAAVESEAEENALAVNNDAAAETDAETEAEADEEDDEGDFLLEESARVLADYISLSERQISAVSDF